MCRQNLGKSSCKEVGGKEVGGVSRCKEVGGVSRCKEVGGVLRGHSVVGNVKNRDKSGVETWHRIAGDA